MANYKLELIRFSLKEKGKKTRKIIDHNIDGSDRIWLRLDGEKEEIQFNPKTQEIVLGGKVVEPYLSYAINRWNVMLPFITYRFHKKQCEAYLESIKYDGSYEA